MGPRTQCISFFLNNLSVMRSLFRNLVRTRYSNSLIEPGKSQSQSPACNKYYLNLKQAESRVRILKQVYQFSENYLYRSFVRNRSMESSSEEGPFLQNLFVMRHGERIDNFDPNWIHSASRPWDPPLTNNGKLQARATGERLRTEGWNITRVICSPFLRCIQTAAEVVAALCAVEDHPSAISSRDVTIDPSKVKVSIEYGLCEVMNYYAIRNPPSSSDISWTLDHAELEAILPAGTMDHSLEPLWPELPHWPENTDDAHKRYSTTIQALAEKFPRENVLCVTHGEGVGVSVSALKKDVSVYAVDYCAYSHAQRSIFGYSTDGGLNVGKFDVLTKSNQSGILFRNR